MRSELIFGALTHVSNRYQLCQLASKATRKLHKPNTRLQDTMNDVLLRFRETSPAAAAAARTETVTLPQQTHRRAA
ncbi:MAG: DNA-directed RNA polymerase subunit omega [Acidobacteriaceae bacterium]